MARQHCSRSDKERLKTKGTPERAPFKQFIQNDRRAQTKKVYAKQVSESRRSDCGGSFACRSIQDLDGHWNANREGSLQRLLTNLRG